MYFESACIATNLMRLHVFLDVRFLRERPTAHDALEGLLAGVGADVLLQVKVLGECLVTILAHQLLLRLQISMQ